MPRPRQHVLSYFDVDQQHPPGVRTDDQGRFRISGIPSGKYILTTSITLNHSPAKIIMDDGTTPATTARQHMYPEFIMIYAPSTFRRTDARIFKIDGDEQINGADLTIDPSSLHVIRGKLLAREDRHAPGNAMITLKEDGTKGLPRMAEIEADGSFEFNYIPSGKYTVRALANDMLQNSTDNQPPNFYKTASVSVIITDQDIRLDDILLVPLKPGEKNDDDIFFQISSPVGL